jgi:hypothetical protein
MLKQILSFLLTGVLGRFFKFDVGLNLLRLL